MNSPYSKENVRQGILHYMLGRGLAGLGGFATVILLVRYMDVQSYAGFTALTGVIVLAGIFAGLGLERAISRYVPEAMLHRSVNELSQFIWRITFIKLFAALFASLLFWVLWQPLLHIFPDVKLVNFPVALICFVMAETLFQHFSSVFQAMIKQKTLTRILIVQWAGRLIMIAWVVMQHSHIGLEESLWIMAIPEMIGVVVFAITFIFHINTLKKSEKIAVESNLLAWPDWAAIGKMASHNYSFTLLAAPPQGYFMKMLAAAFLPTQMVAAYGFFINIAEKARQYIPLHLLYNLIEPVMIGNYLQNNDFKTLNHRCQLLYKSNLLILIPLLAWITAAGPIIIASLTGGKFQEYNWLLMLVMLQLTVGSHVVLLQLILNSVGMSKILVSAGLYALLGMALFLAICMLINLHILVVAPLVFSLICNFYIINKLQKSGYAYALSLRLYVGACTAGVLASLVTFVIIQQPLLNSHHPLVMSIVSGMLIAIIYAIGLYFFKAIHTDELHLLKSILQKKSNLSNINSFSSNSSNTHLSTEKFSDSNVADSNVADNNVADENLVRYLQNKARIIIDSIIPNDAHIILLDYPNNTNVGDSLIWLGEIAYLKSRNLMPSYVCDMRNYSKANIKKILNKNTIILMHGGGNFGTIWPEIHNFRLRVLQDFVGIPIIQLPQTIYFDDAEKTVEMAAVIKKHGNYHLLTRCQNSYEFAQKYLNAQNYLCPDMAFFIGAIEPHQQPVVDHFILSRTDKEKSAITIATAVGDKHLGNTELADWLEPHWQERILHRLEIHTAELRAKFDPYNKLLLIVWNQLSKARLQRGVMLLSRGHVVISDRLHVHILCILINKPHLLIDNVYGKISNFYHTWTFTHPSVIYVKDINLLRKSVAELSAFLTLKKANIDALKNAFTHE